VKRTFLQINPTDNVLVALCDLKKGEEVVLKGKTIILQDDIAAKHKFTIDDLKQGEEVTMYGVLVGKAQMPIPAGGLIHTFNLKHASEPFQGKLKDYTWQAPDVSAWQNRTFMGYHRSDGQVGTQNYWLVIPLVFAKIVM
jgi:altronate hydrolase